MPDKDFDASLSCKGMLSSSLNTITDTREAVKGGMALLLGVEVRVAGNNHLSDREWVATLLAARPITHLSIDYHM